MRKVLLTGIGLVASVLIATPSNAAPSFILEKEKSLKSSLQTSFGAFILRIELRTVQNTTTEWISS